MCGPGSLFYSKKDHSMQNGNIREAKLHVF